MKVGFVKSFKVSGTTVADILLKISYYYGKFYDQKTESLAFTNEHSNIYGYISNFDIFVEDTRWNFDNVKNILGNDFISLTIMRNPVCQFESMFHFMNMETHYNVSSFEMFLEKLEAGKITNERFQKIRNEHIQIFGRNQLAYTLGFEETFFEDNTAIEAFIEEIDRQFNLVMISEYFEESVIILKNILGTQIGQMTFMPLLVRTNDTKHKLSVKQRLLLEKWLSVDVRLYNTFKRSLERRLTKKVREEARILKFTNSALRKFCKVEYFSSESYGSFKLNLHTGNRSTLFCDVYLGPFQDKSQSMRRFVKNAGELQRLF